MPFNYYREHLVPFFIIITIFMITDAYQYSIGLASNSAEELSLARSIFRQTLSSNYTLYSINSLSPERSDQHFCDDLFLGQKQMQLQLLLLLGTSKHDWLLSQAAERFQLPGISIGTGSAYGIARHKNKPFWQVPMRHPFEQLGRLIRDLIKARNIQASVVFASEVYLNRIQVQELESENVRFQLLPWNLTYELHSGKKIPLPGNESAVFVVGKPKLLSDYMDQLNLKGLFNSQRTVYAINTGRTSVNCSSCRHATYHLLQLHPTNLHDTSSQATVCDQDDQFRIRCNFYEDLARLISKTVLVKPEVFNVSSCRLNTPYAKDIPNIHPTTTQRPETMWSSLQAAFPNVFGQFGDFECDKSCQLCIWRFNVQEYRCQYLRDQKKVWRLSEWYDGNVNGGNVNGGNVNSGSENNSNGSSGRLYSVAHLQEEDDEDAKELVDDGEKKRLVLFVVVHPPLMMRMLLPNDTSSQNKTGNDDEDDGQTDKRLDNENKEKDDDDGDNSSDDLELDSEDESDEETYKPRYKYYGFLMDLLKCLEAEMAKQGNTFPEYEIREVEPSTDSSASSSSSSDKTDPPGTFYGGDKVTANGPVFSGILKEMKQAYDNKEDSMALAAMTITASRELVMDFTDPIFRNVGITILMKKPRRKPHFFKFITVLESKVWACIAGAYLFTSLLLAIFEQFSPSKYRQKRTLRAKQLQTAAIPIATTANPNSNANDDSEDQGQDEPSEPEREFTLKESLWFCITSLTPQGGGEAPRSLYGRLVAATWWLFGFIVIASYTANLAAFLTVSRLESKIDDLKKLSKQYKVRYAPIDDTATDFYFLQMAEIEEKFYEIWKDMSLNDSLTEDERANLAVWDYPVSDRYTKISAQMSEAQKPKTVLSAIEKVRDSKDHQTGFAILAESLTVDYFSMQFCDLYKVGEEFSPRPLALAVNKNNSVDLISMLNPALRRLEEDGRIDELRAQYWVPSDGNERLQCEEFRKLNNGISLLNAGGVFIVIGAGLLLTLCCLTVENAIIVQIKVNRVREAKFPTISHRPQGRLRRWISIPLRFLWSLLTGVKK